MREAVGNLWTYDAHIRVITTNGELNSRGEMIMGKGTAQQAKVRYPGITKDLGGKLKEYGNVPLGYILGEVRIWTFPVKYRWQDDADLTLVGLSAQAIAENADALEERWLHRGKLRAKGELVIAMPRPGCGNGGLDWEVVRPLLQDLLDDRFVVLTLPGHGRLRS